MSEGVSFVIRDQYVMDLSFESHGPKVFKNEEGEEPEFNMNVHVTGGVNEASTEDDAGYYIDLTMNITAALNGQTGYILEIKYRCEFDITDASLPEEEVKHLVLAEVPRYMFPFIRHEVARITGEGGFTPLRLMPIVFSVDGAQPIDESNELPRHKTPSIH